MATSARSPVTGAQARHARGPGFLVRRLQQVSVSIFHDYLRPLDITPLQNTILLHLQKDDGLDQVTVATRARIDTSTMKDVVARLEAKGLLRREPGTLDRRTRLLFITPAGRELLDKAAVEARRASQHLLSPLRADERKIFLDMIDRVVQAHEGTQADAAGLPWRRMRAQG
jgi:DNA-binding MarR family transcriptional regulator